MPLQNPFGNPFQHKPKPTGPFMASDYEMPDRINPVYAYRCWLPHNTSTPMGSIQGLFSYNSTWWAPKLELRAECKMGKPHRSPWVECTCGIYALNTADTAISYYTPGIVGGIVALWGKVIVGMAGYRAEFAYPALLYYDRPTTELQLYGVPILGSADFATAMTMKLPPEYWVKGGKDGQKSDPWSIPT